MGGAWRDPALKPVPPSRGMMGRYGDEAYGLPLICDILDRYGVKATFFLEPFNDELGHPGQTEPVCRFLVDEFDGGIEMCEKARQIEPDNIMVLHKLALAYLHTGRWRQARDMARLGLRIEPEHAGLTSIPQSYLGFCIRRAVRRLLSRFRKK